MPLFTFEQCRVIRQQNSQPLKTKIVATIGSPGSYSDGLFNMNGQRQSLLTYDYLVKGFYDNGVDVIRLNLSHLPVDQIESTVVEIRKAILKREHENKCRKRIALLADLPGPKIRFRFTRFRITEQSLENLKSDHIPEAICERLTSLCNKEFVGEAEFIGVVRTAIGAKQTAICKASILRHAGDPLRFRVGQQFTVHFRDIVLTDTEATAYVDNEPLKKALLRLDKNRVTDAHVPIDDLRISENLFGDLAEQGRSPDSFQLIMNQVRAKLNGGERVLVIIGDGEVVMEVNAREFNPTGTKIKCTAVTVKGGEISIQGNKGFTLKGVDVNIQSFTNEDRDKLRKVLDAEYKTYGKRGWEPVVTFIALSFAQTADDILKIRYYLETKLRRYLGDRERARLESPSIIAKIETNKGWKNRHFILDVADGIMVARGDLGLQMDIEDVPALQKKLIRLCNKRGKPVITATEMLKSMTESIEPTRAEGTDVFNAILDGSDAVMMSEETSKGRYPFHSIRKMISIAVQAEQYYEMQDVSEDLMGEISNDLRRKANELRFQKFLEDDFERIKKNDGRFGQLFLALMQRIAYLRANPSPNNDRERRIAEWRRDLYGEKTAKSNAQSTTNRITLATCTLSEGEDIKGIVAASTSGRTVRMISRLRPIVAIAGAAHDVINTRKLVVSYGVVAIHIDSVPQDRGTDGIFDKCQQKIIEDEYLKHLLKKGSDIIFTAGTPLGRPGTTNLIQIRRVGASDRKKAHGSRSLSSFSLKNSS